MGQIIVNGGSFNAAGLQADDLYIQIIPPPASVVGVPVDVVGVVGTASWGPLNAPTLLGTPGDGARNFGPIPVWGSGTIDLHDLATEIVMLFQQAPSQAQLQVWASRISDGTDAPAFGSVMDGEGTPVAGGVVEALYSGIAGDQLSLTISPGALANTFNVVIGGFPGVPAELFPNIPNSAGSFWQNLANALALGQSGIRPPSQFARFIPGTPTEVPTEAPTLSPAPDGTHTQFTFTLANGPVQQGTLILTDSHGVIFADSEGNGTLQGVGGTGTVNYVTKQVALTYSVAPITATTMAADYDYMVANTHAPVAGSTPLANGADGRAGVNTAALLGSDASLPKTGLYALRSLNPAPSMAYLAGMTDGTIVSNLQGFADSEGVAMAFAFPTGTSSQAAVTAKQGYGILDFEMLWLKDWIYWYDPVNQQVRLVPPYSTILGRTATLPPHVSPGNKEVFGIIGTERNSPYSGNIPYSNAEIGLLESAGILFVTNPIPAGQKWGIRHGQNGNPVPPADDVAYTRMTNMLEQLMNRILGQFVDQPQSQSPKDPTRDAMKTISNAELQSLQDLGMIDTQDMNGGPGYLVVCDLTNNTPAQIAARYSSIAWRVVYLSNIRFLIGSLQGGTTVVTQGNSQSQALAGQGLSV